MAGPSQELEQQQEGTTDNLPRWCAEAPCRRRPFFGPVGGKPIFCQRHSRKSEGMVDVSSRRCEAVGCAKWPLYGHEGQKAKFCSLHKGPSMIDVRSRRCAAPDCKRQPSYGFEGKRACFCAAHKAEGMVDVVSRRCERPNCRRRPLYGFEGKKSQFCSAHKQEGQVDVCNRRCQFPGCSKRPCFGLPGKRPCFCGSHRSVEMVDVISHKCNYPGCSHPTGYETSRVRSKFCDQHKSVGLAGASLLQLAVSAAFDDAAHQPPMSRKTAPPGGSANLSKDPWKSGAEPGVSAEEPRRKGCPQVAVGASESGSGASPPRTRFPEPVSGEIPSRDVKSEATAERRIVGTGASPLPSLGALLDEIPRTHLKRPREARDGEHGTGSVTSTLSSAAETSSLAVTVSSSAVTSSKSSLSSSSNPSLPTYPSQPILSPPPLEAPGIALSKFGDGGDNCTSKGKGMAKMNGVNHDTDGSKKCGGAMDEGSHCASASSAVSSQHRSAAGVKRLFTGPERGSRGWQTASTEWNSQLPVETGFLTRSPTLDWRQAGLSSLGRTASLEEAQAAALRQGLEVDDGKPRRASAFFTHGSSLPPVVTEMGRRCSALESRRAPIRAPHYSELLSAKAPLRSVTAYTGGVERYRLFPGFERQHGAGAENEPEARLDISLLAPAALPSIQSLTAPSPNRQVSSDDAAGYNQSLDEDPTGVRFTRYINPAKRVFHVIPAATAYMAGSALPSRGAGFPANASLPSRSEWQPERLPPPKRFSLSSRTALEVSEPEIARDYRKALRTTPQKEQGHFPAMNDRFVAADQDSKAFVPAWGAVVEGEAGYIEKRGDTARYNTGVACISSGAALSGQRAAVCGGYSIGEGNAPSPECLPRPGSRLSDKERGTLSGGSNLSHPRRPSTLEQSLSVAGIHELSHPKSPAAGLPPQPTNSATSSPGAEGQAGSSSHAWRRSTAERPSTSPSKQGNTFREAAEEAHTIVKGSAVEGGSDRHNFDVGFNSGPGSVRRGSVASALETMEPSMRPSMSRRPFISPSVLAARESKDTSTAQPGRLQRESFVGEK